MNQFDNIDLILEASKQPYISIARLYGGFTSGSNTFIHVPKFDCFVRYNKRKFIRWCKDINQLKECIKTNKKPIIEKQSNDAIQHTLKFE